MYLILIKLEPVVIYPKNRTKNDIPLVDLRLSVNFIAVINYTIYTNDLNLLLYHKVVKHETISTVDLPGFKHTVETNFYPIDTIFLPVRTILITL